MFKQWVGPLRAVLLGSLLLAGQAMAGTTIKEGTPVELRFLQTISSATATAGEKVDLEVVSDVVENGKTLIPSGSRAMGVVQSAKKKGFLGKSGELNLNLSYVLGDGVRVPLRASQGSEGEGRIGTAVALTVLFGPIGLLKRGLDITIPAGQTLTATVDASTEIASP